MTVNLVPPASPPSAAKPWIIMKFGGTSVATRDRWQNIKQLATSRRAEGARVFIVVSALSGVTDKLKALTGITGSEARLLAAEDIIKQHLVLLGDMALFAEAPLKKHFARLRELATAGPGEEPLAWHAEVQAHGELMSSTLGAQYLNATGLDTVWVDSRQCLHSRAVAHEPLRRHLLAAVVDAEPAPQLARELAPQGRIFIAQGFIASDDQGRTVLLGRGGSDTSAAYYGALLQAARVETWTDVTGMFSANPRQVVGTRLLKRLDYDEAQEIASTGAKILHPRCLRPLRKAGVPLLIKDTNHPDMQGTLIGPYKDKGVQTVKAVSTRKDITLISMESVDMWQQVGFMADVFDIFREHGLSVDLVGTSETNVTVSLDPNENLLDSAVITRLTDDLSGKCRVKVIAPCAAITLVGRGMRSMLHTLAPVLEKLEHSRVHLVSQSSNNLNLTFVVDEPVVDALVPEIHELLIRSGSLRGDDGDVFGPSFEQLYNKSEVVRKPSWWHTPGKRQALLDAAQDLTPAYIYHMPTIRRQAQSIASLDAIDRRWYAVKANPHPEIIQTLAAEGFGLECVSPGEMDAVRQLLPNAPILFTPNFAKRHEYADALAHGAYVTLDASYPLEHWPEIFAGRSILLRVDLGRGFGLHEKVRTGGDGSKFGVPWETIETVAALAAKHDVTIRGLHAHLGSGVLDAGHWRQVATQLVALASRIPTVKVLNLGGGLGVPMHPGESPLDISVIRKSLAAIKQQHPQYELWMEPGRYLVAEAGVLLTSVTQTKDKGNKHYLGVDAGMHNMLRPALYDAWHEIANLTQLNTKAAAHMLYQVVGQICETGDVLGRDRRLPVAKAGDVMLLADAGAYGACMASHYNLREAAVEIVLDE